MEHVRNLFYGSKNLDVIVKGTVTGKSVDNKYEVLYQIETEDGDCFEANERCVYPDVTKPVVVEQFVANWYEEHKNDLEYNIWDWMKYNLEPKKLENVNFSQWLCSSINNPVETLIKMKLYGYEVEENKRYTVKIKGDVNENILVYGKGIQRYFFSSTAHGTNKRGEHTKEQIEEAGFGEVFNSPLFEVEEVEE